MLISVKLSIAKMIVCDIYAERADFYIQRAEAGEDQFMYPITPTFDGKRKVAASVEVTLGYDGIEAY